MKQLTRAQFASLKLLLAGLIAADLFAIWVWATRPLRIYSDWLGLAGFASDAPVRRLVTWAAWDDGPRTPSGFLVLFDLGELIFAGVLLFFVILLMLSLLLPRETDAPLWHRISARVGLLRFRLRTALVLLAIFGLYLGWEIHAWRTWRLSSDYRRQADQAAKGVESNLSTLRSMREELAHTHGNERNDDSVRRVYYRLRAAESAGITVKDLKKREVDVLLAKLVAHTELKLKYERAAANPPYSVAPGRPLPQTEKEAADWLRLRDDPRSLAVYDELARTYPDLVEAHSRSAWLRATCPDARYRDGKLAVASATRACELTKWGDPDELEVLAAAFAEAGDFAQAVKWQQKVLAMTVPPANTSSCQQRIDLYLAGKAYRQQ